MGDAGFHDTWQECQLGRRVSPNRLLKRRFTRDDLKEPNPGVWRKLAGERRIAKIAIKQNRSRTRMRRKLRQSSRNRRFAFIGKRGRNSNDFVGFAHPEKISGDLDRTNGL